MNFKKEHYQTLHEILAGYLIQNAITLGQAEAIGADVEMVSTIRMSVAFATQMQEDLISLSLGEEPSDGFLESLSRLVRTQIRGFDTKKIQAAKEGNLLLEKEDYEFYDSLKEISEILPEVEDTEESKIVIPS